MASLRDIQNKISGVKKTQQITKAMNMVASAKLRGAQSRIERFRPYADKFHDILVDLTSRVEAGAHPLLEKREVIQNVGIILVTSDKGLCGSFNMNLCSAAYRLAKQKKEEGKTVKFICIGRKGRDFVRKTKFEIVAQYIENMTDFDFQLAVEVGDLLIDGYLTAQFDEVHIVYGQFVNIMRQVSTAVQILPAETSEEEPATGPTGEYVFEPSVEGLLAEILPRYVKVQVYRGLLDTSAGEHAARMAAMDNATKNCDEMVDSLTLIFNKARQASITTQLIDIVGGAEALKG
jgi:F-type H+-transporting ATPase subunit gamma